MSSYNTPTALLHSLAPPSPGWQAHVWTELKADPPPAPHTAPLPPGYPFSEALIMRMPQAPGALGPRDLVLRDSVCSCWRPSGSPGPSGDTGDARPFAPQVCTHPGTQPPSRSPGPRLHPAASAPVPRGEDIRLPVCSWATSIPPSSGPSRAGLNGTCDYHLNSIEVTR